MPSNRKQRKTAPPAVNKFVEEDESVYKRNNYRKFMNSLSDM